MISGTPKCWGERCKSDLKVVPTNSNLFTCSSKSCSNKSTLLFSFWIYLPPQKSTFLVIQNVTSFVKLRLIDIYEKIEDLFLCTTLDNRRCCDFYFSILAFEKYSQNFTRNDIRMSFYIGNQFLLQKGKEQKNLAANIPFCLGLN